MGIIRCSGSFTTKDLLHFQLSSGARASLTKLPVWWTTYVRKIVNASSLAGDADQNPLLIVEN